MAESDAGGTLDFISRGRALQVRSSRTDGSAEQGAVEEGVSEI